MRLFTRLSLLPILFLMCACQADSDDGADPDATIFYLSDFVYDDDDEIFIPNGTTWTIYDEEGDLDDFTGLRAALMEAHDQGRLITLSFPYFEEAIPANAFYYNDYDGGNEASSLYSISMPEATWISSGAFKSSDNLKYVYCPKATGIESEAFYECDALTDITNSFALVLTIGDYAFSECTALQSVSFPAATTINKYAFYNCDALTDISFPKTTDIGYYAFTSCDALTDITAAFPRATSITRGAFSSCSKLTDVSFPRATTLGSYVFRYSPQLVNLELSTGVLSTGYDAELTSLGSEIFVLSDGSTHEGDVILTMGEANSANINGNKLTVTTLSYDFLQIKYPD